ncbi:MAG: glycosyltransferase [Firmicutes bacterium]|nr:glycosyltransferase [Bacillota bacterium]
MGRPFLSAALIVKNEEAVLDQCLRSLQPVVDEIVVVDTGSEDRTPEIAREMGALLVRTPWRDDFAAARNVAQEFARGRWILSADADEVLEVNGDRLRAVLEATSDSAFTVTVRNALLGPGDELAWEDVPVVRLFRKRAGVLWEGRIHEQILPSITRLGGTLGHLDWVVLRQRGYLPEELARKGTRERNRRIFEALGEDLPPYLLYQRGVQDAVEGRLSEARRHLARALGRDPTAPWAARAARLSAEVAEKLGKVRSALALLKWAQSRWPAYTDLWLLEGQIGARRGNPLGAAAAFTECLVKGDADVPWEHVTGAGSYIALMQLGECFLMMGDARDAVPVLERALELRPGYAPAERALRRARELLEGVATGA